MAKQIEAGLKIKAGVEGAETLRQLADEIEAMGGDTAQLREQSKSLGEAWQRVAAQQALIARFRELKTESRGLADELAATQANINTLAQRMQADPSAALRRQFDAATQKAARLKDKQSELQQSLQRVRNEMRAAELPTRNLHQEQARLGEAAKAAEAKLHGLTVEAQRLKATAAARVRLGLDVDDRVRREITATTAAYRTLRSSGTLTKQQLARATELYKARLRELKAELDGVPGKMTPIASSLKGLGTAGLAAAGVGGGLYAVKEGVQAILDKTQEFQQIRKRLDYAFGGAEEGGKQLDFVRGVVERLGLDMVSAANGYAQLAAATKDLNISHVQTQQIFSGVANAVAAMNLSADEANGVFLALSQIAGKGKVSMEELRGQLGERLSPAMAIAAKSMGVTTAELEKMVESGISAEEFLPKFGAALEQAFAADAARNVETLNGQINLLKNRFAELLNGFGEGGVAEAAISVLQDIGGMLDWLEERINGMDATVSGGLKDTFVSAYDAIKEGAVAVYDLLDTVLDVINSIGGGISTLAGNSAEDFDFIKGLINSVNIAFPGVAYPSPTYANPPSQLLETQVADTASYYGVRPLAAPITAQSGMIQVDQIYEKLVPTSIIETAFADQFPTGAGVWIPTAPRRRMAQIAGSYSGDIYLESSVQPGTVELPGYTDDGQGHLKKDNSGDVLAVDYEKGVIRAASGFDLEVLAVPAARYSAANYTAIINVDDTNQGTEWAPLLRPKPAPGATAVSFISGGNWYTLTDNGDYVLRDADGTVRGRVERSGSVLISLPAQPDVDSKIVVAWSPLDAFKAIDGQEPGNTVTLPPVQPTSRLTDNSLQNIKPGTLRLGWSHNGSKSATDSNGALSGDVQGAVDYAQGIITLQNAPNAAYSVTADVYTEQRTVKQMALTTNADLVGGTIGPCQAGTVLIEVTATFSESESKSYWDWSAVNGFGQSARRGTRTHSSRRAYAHAISDDGNGGLVLYGKKLPGATINYVSGTFSIPLAALARDARHIRYQDHQIDNKATPISISVVDDGGPQRKYSASVSAATVSYIAAGAATRRLTLTLSNNSQAANVLQNKPWPRQCLLNSWVFRLGSTRLIERDGTLYKNIDPKTGNGEAVGYLDALSGELVFKDAGASGDVVIEAGVYSLADMRLKQYYGRTPAAPVKPQSFTVYAEAAGHTRTGTSQADESITGERLQHIPDINRLRRQLAGLLAPVPRSKLVPPAIKAAIVAAIRSFGGYIDLDCLVSWLLFSGNTAADLDELCRKTMYNCISLSDYPEAQGYLQGVEIVSQSYRELLPQHIGNPRTLLVLDPPYVCTQQGNYRKAAYFGMVEFLRLMAMVRPPFIFFSSTRSELPAYLDLVAELRLPGWERFSGCQTVTVGSTINHSSRYDDHLIYKF
ncbi:tape measure domain [Eikenella corrodens]|uniref:Tape measure domain protein n=2 Tax=Eikenella corrodens TaxID=539 RepID=C0DVN7_EIKCO|nr:tape measure protein [Eikenella corrodens]EEG23911.1 tape measure domain protein [Eikenella corrodens ATCC 23834]UAK75324.1 tape measure protein [Eikenella corrodens]SNW07678.1 tape measure domain [Eikenella corrodens]